MQCQYQGAPYYARCTRRATHALHGLPRSPVVCVPCMEMLAADRSEGKLELGAVELPSATEAR